MMWTSVEMRRSARNVGSRVALTFAFAAFAYVPAMAGTGTAYLSGAVVANGRPFPGALVTAAGNSFTATTTSDAVGHFAFANLPIGVYDVTATGGAGRAMTRVDLSGSGATVDLDIGLKTIGVTRVVRSEAVRGSGTDVTLNSTYLQRSPASGSFPEFLIQLPGAVRGANGVVHLNGDHGVGNPRSGTAAGSRLPRATNARRADSIRRTSILHTTISATPISSYESFHHAEPITLPISRSSTATVRIRFRTTSRAASRRRATTTKSKKIRSSTCSSGNRSEIRARSVSDRPSRSRTFAISAISPTTSLTAEHSMPANGGAPTDCATALTTGLYNNGTCAFSLRDDKTATDYRFQADYVQRFGHHEVRAGGAYEFTDVGKAYAVTFEEPVARNGRAYLSIAHTVSLNKSCETQLLAPCFGSPTDWTSADHDQRYSVTGGLLANDRYDGCFSFDGEYGSGLSSASCPLGTPNCKATPHTIFALEKGFGLGPDMALTIRGENIFNDRYYVTLLNAHRNHYAPPRTLDIGIRFGR